MAYQVRGLKPGWTITRRLVHAFGRYHGECCIYCGRRAAEEALRVPVYHVERPFGVARTYRACSVIHLGLGLLRRLRDPETGKVSEEGWPWP